MTQDGKPVVERPYSYRLVLRCFVLVLMGAAATVLILLLSLNRPVAGSYGDGYRMLSALREEMLYKSLVIYLSTSLLVLCGISVISLLYSHRVAGPIYRLGMAADRVASGDFTERVRLRSADAVHPLADDINSLSSHYGELLRELESETKELRGALSAMKGRRFTRKDPDLQKIVKALMERTDRIREILAHVRV